MPGLSDTAIVVRTELNVAHIYAADRLDLHRVQGFITARDRYAQLELTRRFGKGTVAEIVGPLGLAVDVGSRTQAIRFLGQRVYEDASADLLERWEAYADGVNQYISAVQAGELPAPKELSLAADLLGVDDPSALMEPIDAGDVAAAAAVVLWRMSSFDADVVRQRGVDAMESKFVGDGPLFAERKAGLLEDIIRNVVPAYRVSATAPGTGFSQAELRKDEPRRLAAEATSELRLEPKMTKRFVDHLHRIQQWMGKPTHGDFGSNSWAVSSEGTGGHGSILANDGHLPLTIPSLFYQQCLDADYFEGDGYKVCGLFIPGVPLTAVGTNGHVAWGQTNINGDTLDFYREQIRLGQDGLPKESFFQGQWQPLERIDEVYRVPALGDASNVSEETWPRWTTFDGRWIISVEGRPAESSDSNVVYMDGEKLVPEDQDGDQIIQALSFDWTALDMGQTASAIDDFALAESISDIKEDTRRFLAYEQNLIASDDQGNVMHSAYHPMPCRKDLRRDDSGQFLPGFNPTEVLDGTEVGGFEIPLDDQGRVVESAGCVVPFEAGPRVENPSAGYVVTANQDPVSSGFDDRLGNDEWYFGGPHSLGYRAYRIEEVLAEQVAQKAATVEASAQLQGDHRSALGVEYGTYLVAAIRYAAGLSGTLIGSDDRLRALYGADRARIDAAAMRILGWIDRGAQASSGVATFYQNPTEMDREDAVATMIFNAWLRAFARAVFDDEDIEDAFLYIKERTMLRALHHMMAGRDNNNTPGLASFSAETGESAYFDVLDTEPLENSKEVMISALSSALDDLTERFGTEDMSQWLWGLQHQVVFESLLAAAAGGSSLVNLLAADFALDTTVLPLAPDLSASDPRKKLESFPRDGSWVTVDYGSPGFDGDDYSYSQGPVMRMVIGLDDGAVSGVNILPGGQSGVPGSPHFADQAEKWLANETVPIRFEAEDAAEARTKVERFSP